MQRSGNTRSGGTGVPPPRAGEDWVAAMRRGDDAAAWRIADAVLAARDPATRDDPRLPYHHRWVWDGRDLTGRDVLVRCYHGLGDTLMCARYLAPLGARAARVTLEAPAVLVPLLRGCPGVDRAVPFDHARPLPPAEVDVEIMELGHALRLGPDQVGPVFGTAGRPPTPHDDDPIAICWTSGDWNPARSVPLGAMIAALPHGAPLVSLQRGPASAEAVAGRFHNPGDDDADVTRTAALIRASRLVVTVDTMVAHLAGTLGAPTLLLLKHDPDWRWERGEGVSRWYPSVTMARQTEPGDWSAPLAATRTVAAGAVALSRAAAG